MDHHQPEPRALDAGSEHRMTSSPSSGPTRQLARKHGLARVRAVTASVGAASVLGAVGIAVTLARTPAASASMTAGGASTAQGATSEQGTTPEQGTRPEQGTTRDGDDDGTSSQLSQLQSVTPPRLSDNPPNATSGGS